MTCKLRTFVEPVGNTVEDELRVSGKRELNGGRVWVALVVNVVVVYKYLQCRIPYIAVYNSSTGH